LSKEFNASRQTFTLLFGILHLVNIHLDVVHGNTVFGK
jgi:hypothetical protein